MTSRRTFLRATAVATLLGQFPLTALAQSGGKMKIGIVGSGRVGSAIGASWVGAMSWSHRLSRANESGTA